MPYHNFIGIDIGKLEFVAGCESNKKTSSYDNKAEGWERFVDEHKSLLSDALIVLESTGGYESGLLKFLVARGLSVHRADARKVKNFIRSFGKYAKTDAIDSLALAKYAREREAMLGLYVPPSEAQETLRLLAERRLDLNQMLTQEKNRSKAPLNKPLLPKITVVINFLKKQLEEISEAIEEVMAKHKEFERKRQILETVPGIGSVTANALLALMPELGTLDRKKVASLAGLAPHPKQSGTKTWYSPTIGGRRDLRPILFMAAMGAQRSKGTHLSEFYARLTDNGKKKMVALTAVMRKIIVIANARLRDEFYQSNFEHNSCSLNQLGARLNVPTLDAASSAA
jgi:transposase